MYNFSSSVVKKVCAAFVHLTEVLPSSIEVFLIVLLIFC